MIFYTGFFLKWDLNRPAVYNHMRSYFETLQNPALQSKLLSPIFPKWGTEVFEQTFQVILTKVSKPL